MERWREFNFVWNSEAFNVPECQCSLGLRQDKSVNLAGLGLDLGLGIVKGTYDAE